MRRMKWTALLTDLQVASGLIGAAWAESRLSTITNRAIKMVVPIPPGVTADVFPRIVADKLSDPLEPTSRSSRTGPERGTQSRRGDRGQISTRRLHAAPRHPKARWSSAQTSFRSCVSTQPRSFRSRSTRSVPYVLVVNPTVPVSSLSEFIAYAKANPDKINYASSGVGSSLQLDRARCSREGSRA